MKFIYVLSVLVFIVSCSTYTPPNKISNTSREITINDSFESVYKKAINWCIANRMTIKSQDEKIGLIVCEKNFNANELPNNLDCGSLSSDQLMEFTSHKCTVSIVVNKIDDKTSKVTISSEYTADLITHYDQYSTTKKVVCNSNGYQENNFINYMKNN